MKASRIVKLALRIASEVLTKVPVPGDSALMIAVKLAGCIDSAQNILRVGSESNSYFRNLDADERRNKQFVDLFWGTPMRDAYDIETAQLDDYHAVRIARERHGRGVLHFEELQGWSLPRMSDRFFSSRGFSFGDALDVLWDANGQQVHVEVVASEAGPKTVITSLPLPGELSESRKPRLLALRDRVERYRAQGESCTYMFLGMQGAGKTTSAQHLAILLDDRCMRVDAASLSLLGVAGLEFLLEELGPGVMIIDDVDKCAVDNVVLTTMLSMLSDLHARRPGLTVVLTAASLDEFDSAMMRPGRVDKVEEFAPLSLAEREEVLASCDCWSSAAPSVIAAHTDGLSPAYLKGLATQLRCGDSLDEALRDAKRMREMVATGSRPTEVAQ